MVNVSGFDRQSIENIQKLTSAVTKSVDSLRFLQ